jgi:hypothetical protein
MPGFGDNLKQKGGNTSRRPFAVGMLRSGKLPDLGMPFHKELLNFI